MELNKYGYNIATFSNEDIKDYARFYKNNIGATQHEIEDSIKRLSINADKIMLTDEINQMIEDDTKNNKANGGIEMNRINREGKTYLGSITKQLVKSEGNFMVEQIAPAKREVLKEIVANNELPNTLREIITITDDEHLETMPSLTYVKEKLASNGIELSLNNSSIYFDRLSGHILTEVSDTVVHASERTLDDLLKDIFINECIAYESTLLLDKDNTSGIIDKDNEHLSLYKQGIEVVEDATLYNAIMKGIKDIPQSFRKNTSIVMNRDHYNSLVIELGEKGLGALTTDLKKAFNVNNIVVNDDTEDVFVGDFKHGVYAKYEPTMYNKRKDAMKGVYQFALNYVFDIKVVPELLRIIKVE